MEMRAVKGGQGTTTVACATAVIASKTAEKVLIIDLADGADTTKWLAAQDFPKVIPNAGAFVEAYSDEKITTWRPWYSVRKLAGNTIEVPEGEWDVVVVDAGTTGSYEYTFRNQQVETERVLCVTNDYMSMKNAMFEKADKIVCFFDENKVLNFNDISNVLSDKNIVKMPLDYALARGIDAGLAVARYSLYEGFIIELLSVVPA